MKSRVVIKRLKDGLYLRSNGDWTPDLQWARDYYSEGAARTNYPAWVGTSIRGVTFVPVKLVEQEA